MVKWDKLTKDEHIAQVKSIDERADRTLDKFDRERVLLSDLIDDQLALIKSRLLVIKQERERADDALVSRLEDEYRDQELSE